MCCVVSVRLQAFEDDCPPHFTIRVNVVETCCDPLVPVTVMETLWAGPENPPLQPVSMNVAPARVAIISRIGRDRPGVSAVRPSRTSRPPG